MSLLSCATNYTVLIKNPGRGVWVGVVGEGGDITLEKWPGIHTVCDGPEHRSGNTRYEISCSVYSVLCINPSTWLSK